MRNFILGLIVGGFAVHLWHKRAARPRGTVVRMPSVAVARPKAEPSKTEVSVTELRPSAGAPSYETAPLTEYSPEYQALAEQLFNAAATLVGAAACEKHAGSCSFFTAERTTAAKIIIYERRRGKEYGAFPMLQDGVYLLLRTQRPAPTTLGVAPRQDERFHYRRVNAVEIEAAAQEIADVLRVGGIASR
ncbi:MAG: hypothetical protein ACE14L_08190 [Terriglobales bacterium]